MELIKQILTSFEGRLPNNSKTSAAIARRALLTVPPRRVCMPLPRPCLRPVWNALKTVNSTIRYESPVRSPSASRNSAKGCRRLMKRHP